MVLAMNATFVIDRGRIRKRKKKPSKRFRQQFGHTPVSVEEEMPFLLVMRAEA